MSGGSTEAGRSDREAPDREAYVEAVLAAVEDIPPGRAATYGDIAEEVGKRFGYGGPRQVGSVLAGYGAAVCWWRVIRADGRPAAGKEHRALQRLRAEGAPVVGDRVRLDLARWRWGRSSSGPFTSGGNVGS